MLKGIWAALVLLVSQLHHLVRHGHRARRHRACRVVGWAQLRKPEHVLLVEELRVEHCLAWVVQRHQALIVNVLWDILVRE